MYQGGWSHNEIGLCSSLNPIINAFLWLSLHLVQKVTENRTNKILIVNRDFKWCKCREYGCMFFVETSYTNTM